MARTLLLPLLLFLAAVCFDNSLAISCFRRNGNGNSSSSNGTTLSCGESTTYCYSFSANGKQFAGCNSIDVCGSSIASSSSDCQNCSTDYCNSMIPSRISCFYRSSSSQTQNGTMITCHSGVSTCYSTMSSYGGSTNYAGCGVCRDQNEPACVTCNSDYCNSRSPSSIRCYMNSYSYSSPPTSNGYSMWCPTGLTSCYIYNKFPNNFYGLYSGCGACNATDDPTCVTCSTDLCNTLMPSTMNCNFEEKYSYSGSTTNLKAATCPSGITTCFSSEIQPSGGYFYGCGNCSADTMPSCVTCTGDYCNDVGANTFSCYHLISGYQTSYSCTKGVNSCYNLTNPIVRSLGEGLIPMSGCGVCTPTTTALYGCTSCSTSNCNGQAASTISPINPLNPWNPSNPSNPWNPSGNATSGISCYHNFGQTQQASQQRVYCASSSSCFDYTFRYGLNRFYFSGCGSCPFGSGTDGSTCRTCSSDYCNSAQRLTGITCYHSFGATSTAASEREEVECSSSSSCFDYSFKFGVSELFFAGCGNCSFDSASTNCRSCFTDLCNSGPGLGACGFSAAAAAAAAAFVMKFVSLG